jgi:DNA-binding NarL/FixJ family response regulator
MAPGRTCKRSSPGSSRREAPGRSFSPGLVPPGDANTIHELLDHTSGLPEFGDDPRVLTPYLHGNLYFNPGVILMDIRMPELDGLEATPRILAADTTFDLDEYVFEALRAGASGYVLKDDSPEQLIAAIRTVAAGDAPLSPAITKRVIERFTRTPRPAPPKEFDELGDRERDVFRLMTVGPSNTEIGSRLYISDTTVKTRVTHILQKLDVRDRVQAVVLAYQAALFDAPG